MTINTRNLVWNKPGFWLGFSLTLILAVALAACAPAATPTAAPAATTAPAAASAAAPSGQSNNAGSNNLILATTTSTQDSGLLDVLIPMFEKSSGLTVKTVAVGSGAAITMGQQGNADVLLVHSPAAEKQFMTDGWGKDRALIMHNDFIIVGPTADPAKIKGLAVVDAFKVLAATGAADATKVQFFGRNDKSGTSVMELSLWKKAAVDPVGAKAAWYASTGQGMGQTLTLTSQKAGYTITDRATYLANKDKLQLDILVQGDKSLLNVYHVITVNSDKWPKVNYTGAMTFLKYMTDPTTQDFLSKFGVDKYGQPLFFPDSTKTDADLGLN